MIIVVHNQATSDERAQLIEVLGRMLGTLRPLTVTHMREQELITLDHSTLDAQALAALREQPAVANIIEVKTPYKLVSRAFQQADTVIQVGDERHCQSVTVGSDMPVVMAGPCAVENREQLLTTARAVKAAGAQILRGGAFKPRTSPYSFQGLEEDGLKILAEARAETGMPLVTEAMDSHQLELVLEYADMIQIGARNMQNYPLLREAGRSGRPVLLKRGPSATIEELLLAAEYIMAEDNPNVVLCERGIRTFENYTRYTLDITAVPVLKSLSHLPVIVDPCHGPGKSRLVIPMARAGVAAGADGLLVEVHPEPDHALCDGPHLLTLDAFATLMQD